MGFAVAVNKEIKQAPAQVQAQALCQEQAQDVKAQLKEPQRQKLPWMNDNEGAPAAPGDLLAAAAATARAAATGASATAAAATEAAMAATAAAAAVAMVATETELAEAAEVVQAHSL